PGSCSGFRDGCFARRPRLFGNGSSLCELMNAPVEIEQLQSVRATHCVSARGQFQQEFFQKARVTVAHPMQFSKMLRRIGLNISLGNGLPNELFSLVDRQWRKVETR